MASAPELAAALRQCDGQQVQVVLLVRDDFWMSATRFLRDLDVRLIEGDNTAAVDLFDTLQRTRCWPISAGPTAGCRTTPVS